ncbi:hypothetical protein OROHE_007289 [Orobanche hederae]
MEVWKGIRDQVMMITSARRKKELQKLLTLEGAIEGGFGPVYKGRTVEGQDIAVKLLPLHSGQGLVDLKNELILISELQHVNLLKIICFFIHRDNKMIIYETTCQRRVCIAFSSWLHGQGIFSVKSDVYSFGVVVLEIVSGGRNSSFHDIEGPLINIYQNSLLKFFYLARPYYEAEQWQECKKTLLRAIHMAPSNYTLRFDVGVSVQKFSASTLQKTKKDFGVEATVPELKNAVRVFGVLSSVSNLHSHGFDEKKIETHVSYCEHLLEVAHIHCGGFNYCFNENWNYFAANRNEKRAPKLEATHYEKVKELYTKV